MNLVYLNIIIFAVISSIDFCASSESEDSKNILQAGLAQTSSQDDGGLSFSLGYHWSGLLYIPTVSAPCCTAHRPKLRDKRKEVETTGLSSSEKNGYHFLYNISVLPVTSYKGRRHEERLRVVGAKTSLLKQECLPMSNVGMTGPPTQSSIESDRHDG
jgi:hypothetical protein